jgi:hypothetical protein
MTVQMVCSFERKYYKELTAQDKMKDTGFVGGIVKFMIHKKI